VALLTSFRGAGRCSNCGTHGVLWIQSHIGDEGATYRVGDDVSADINVAVVRAACFVVREPLDGEPIRVLSAWSCDSCEAEEFAEIVFAGGRVANIQPVNLTVAVLDRTNYVESTYNYKIELYTNHSMWDEYGVWPYWVSTLRESLARAEGTLVAPPEPEHTLKGFTLGGGRYRVSDHYLGHGDDQLWFARSDAHPENRYLVSIAPNNGFGMGDDAPALMQPAPGLFDPVFVGEFDPSTPDGRKNDAQKFMCAYVEELPVGAPLRSTSTDLRTHAIDLGCQICLLLESAYRNGVIDVGLRPEYVWLAADDGRPVVTGIGGRSTVFFAAARRRRDSSSAPLFSNHYLAPEVYRGEAADDRAVVLTIALMVAEWLLGTYPYAPGDGAWGYNRLCAGEHVSLPGPPRLAALLQSAVRPTREERPHLAEFTRALRAFAVK